jgi:hypothetical protein
MHSYITSARHPTIVHAVCAVFLFLIHFQIGYHMLLLPGCPSLRLLLLPILGPTFPCQG